MPADNHLSSATGPCVTGRRYHSMAFIASCVVVFYMITQMLWSTTSAEQLATITLASYYALIRMIQLITMRKPYRLPLHLHGPLVIFDQIYLAAISFTGLPLFLTLPLSGALLFMTRSLGVNYLFVAIPAAFGSILFTIIYSSDFQLNTLTASAISLILVFLFSLNTILPLWKSALRKQTVLNNPNSQHSETREFKQMQQPVSSIATPAEERAGFRILIISTNDNRLRSLTDNLSSWGYDYTTSRNSVQAFRHMLSRYQADRFVPYTDLIVDLQGLDLDPISLARLIQSEYKLKDLKLICFKSPFALRQLPKDLYKAGYKALLDSPLNKAQLFSSLHGGQLHFPDTNNIVSLCKHRADKTSKTDQEIILLADETSSDRANLSKALVQAGYHVLVVDDGNQALDILEENQLSLAIINIKLPIMSGIQVFKLHRFTTPHNRWVPFAFLSDENNADTLRLCRSIGVQACFFKPVVISDILEIIPTMISQHQLVIRKNDRSRTLPNENNVTHFRNAGLLDHMTLLRLEKLDSGIVFIRDLYKIFEAEGSVIIHTMKQAVEEKQFGLFLDQAQILLDSAGQLGALAIYELSRTATRLPAYEFEYRGYLIVEEIEKTFNLTLEAYTNYLSQRAATLQSDHI